MSWTIESAVAQRPFPGKDHDRVFADDEQRIYAVFDGAGIQIASDVALSKLQDVIANSRDFNVAKTFQAIQTATLEQAAGTLTTGSLVHLIPSETTLGFWWGAAGDSPIYRYDHATQTLHRETIDESERHEDYTDARNFLGSVSHHLKQLGQTRLSQPTTLMIASDGITDEFFHGHLSNEKIERLLAQSASAQFIAESVMNETAEFDDASVIIIQVKPSP